MVYRLLTFSCVYLSAEYEGKVTNLWKGVGQPRLINVRKERRHSNRNVTAAEIALFTLIKVMCYKLHSSLLHKGLHSNRPVKIHMLINVHLQKTFLMDKWVSELDRVSNEKHSLFSLIGLFMKWDGIRMHCTENKPPVVTPLHGNGLLWLAPFSRTMHHE